jgi:hypothetical protein
MEIDISPRLFEIEGIPIFPGRAVNFEHESAYLSFKIDRLPCKYRHSFDLEKISFDLP